MALALNNPQRLEWLKKETSKNIMEIYNMFKRAIVSRLLSIDEDTNVQDCDVLRSAFELQLHYNVYFWTNALRKGIDHINTSC